MSSQPAASLTSLLFVILKCGGAWRPSVYAQVRSGGRVGCAGGAASRPRGPRERARAGRCSSCSGPTATSESGALSCSTGACREVRAAGTRVPTHTGAHTTHTRAHTLTHAHSRVHQTETPMQCKKVYIIMYVLCYYTPSIRKYM